jgi:hypothetical protein
MRYAVLIYQDERMWTEATAEERAAHHAAHTAFDEAARARAEMFGGEALSGVASATTLRPGPGGRRVLTDGPFAETTEQLGGFYLIEAPDLDTVTELCTLLPEGYTLEIRPIADMSTAEDWQDAQPRTGESTPGP